eukprot:s3531_g11.t1
MRIHHAKEHQASLVNSLQEKPQAWSLIMRWMECPSVVTASALFPTFVVFKKHILNACPVLLQTSMGPAAATVSEGTQQPLLGQSCREAADVPLMNQADTVQFVLSHSWRELLRDPNMCVRLKNWCVKCGQWVSDAGSGIKTHMRKTHPDLWLLKAEAEDRASKVGLIAQSPCKYCGATVKQPRAHLKHCGSVFQASLYALAVAQDHDDRGGRRDGGSARAGGHLSWVGQVQDATTGGDGGAGIHGEVSSPGSQRRLRQGPERLGQAVAGDWGKPSQEAKASSNQEEMGELVKLLSKMVLKLEDENARLRTECGFILYLDTGEHGNRAGVYKHGWMKDGDVVLDPLWTIMRWDPEKQQQVESTTESPLRHSKVLELIDCLRRTIPQDCVLQRFHSTRPMAESYESPVLPFLMTIGVRSTQAGQAYDALCDLIGCSALRMRHRRERQDRRPMGKPLARSCFCAALRNSCFTDPYPGVLFSLGGRRLNVSTMLLSSFSFLMERARPAAWEGGWQSRREQLDEAHCRIVLMPGKCSIRYMPSVVLEVYWLFSWGATARLEASITRTQHRYPLCQEAFQEALERCAATRHAARGELLRNCLSGIDDETVEKLLPHFKEETRPKGSVLVKAGQLSSSLWLIAGGRCSQAAAAPKPLQEDRPATEGRNREKHALAAPKTKRRFFSATVELGLLEVGQAVGLTTIALQQPEPLTVAAASPEVKLLRADNLPQAKLTPKVLEALRLALRAKSSWLLQRFESLSELPAKLSRKAERMHEELERAKIPLVIDSPFLRRRDQALLPGRTTIRQLRASHDPLLTQLVFPDRNHRGLAAGGGFAAKEAFQYNRENFLWDRNLRRRKEFQIQIFRVDQAELWRKDVRDLISLTEYKMHVYLLVNVLLLGITVALWCQGKLPHTTPVWLMTGSALAMAGSFSFILLSIWMAMHAAVSAQSFETRLLTQMVRLPIPSWQEIEACRTYASEFERLEAKQMFRVPFAMGPQEGLAEGAEEDPAAPADASPVSSTRFGEANRHVDPWGLEGSGADIPELGCKMGHSVQKLRHVKLARQAMVFWQSYDAFARICMSIGVNQLLNAASYFILAYYMSEVKVPSSATYGVLVACSCVVVLTTMAETLNRLDMSLTWWQLRLMQLFLYLGPAIATLAGWAYVEDGHDRQAEGLVVCAFLAHALYLMTMNTLCRMHMEHNGARLPVAFRSVLYLDVFGWSSAAQAHRHQISSAVSESHATFSEAGSERFAQDAANATTKPATGMVEYAESGQAKAHRPED